MTWTKLSDDYSDDCWELSDAAYRLHTEGLTWSNRKLLDGRLPKDDVRRWAKRPEAADELVACGWWEDHGDEYQIVHHACYQRTREQVLAQQQRSRGNGQRGGRPTGPPRERSPRKPRQVTQKETQTGTQVGFRTGKASNGKPRQEPTQVTQLPTQRDGTGHLSNYSPNVRLRTRGELPKSGTSLAETAKSGNDGNGWPEWHGQGPDPFEEHA